MELDKYCSVILNLLFERHANSSSQKNISLGINEIKREIKPKLGSEYKVQNFNHALDYLLQNELIVKEHDLFSSPKGVEKETNIKFQVLVLRTRKNQSCFCQIQVMLAVFISLQ